MNKSFTSFHPSLILLVQPIEERVRDKVNSLERLRRNRNNDPS